MTRSDCQFAVIFCALCALVEQPAWNWEHIGVLLAAIAALLPEDAEWARR